MYHQPQPHPISAEVRGRVRLARRRMAERFEVLDQRFNDPQTRRIASDFTFKAAKGRERAWRRLRALFDPLATLEHADLGKPPLAIWAALCPHDEYAFLDPKSPSGKQQGIAVNYLMAGHVPDRSVTASGAWALWVPNHAAGRLIECSLERNREIDPDLNAILLDAHRGLLRSPMQALANVLDASKEILVPAAGGVFICLPFEGTGHEGSRRCWPRAHLRAQTWVPDDMIFDDQRGSILSGEAPVGERAGDLLLAAGQFSLSDDPGFAEDKGEEADREGGDR